MIMIKRGLNLSANLPKTVAIKPLINKAVENALALEEVARMALDTLALSPSQSSIEPYLLDKHFLRKHGTGAYYGQGR